MANAILVGCFPPSEFSAFLRAQDPELWNTDRFRSSLRGLEETRSILVQYDVKNPLVVHEAASIHFQEAHDRLKPFREYLEGRIPERKLLRVVLALLPPGKEITMHVDPPEYAEMTRYHWVLQTNEDCFMRFRREKFHFAAGECWRFNNRTLHGAVNGGTEDRVHVILDYSKNSSVDEDNAHCLNPA